MKETIYPGDSSVDNILTRALLEGIEVLRNDYFDDLDFLNSLPILESVKWYKQIPEWKNGIVLENKSQIIECKNYAIATPIDRRHYANFVGTLDEENLEESYVKNVIAKNVMERHKQSFYNTFLRIDSFDKIVPHIEWDISETNKDIESNPINDIRNWCSIIFNDTGIYPNQAVISESVFKYLINHNSIREQMGDNNSINKNKLADIFNLNKINTIGWIHNEKKEKYLDCNSFLLCHVPTSNKKISDSNKLKPSAMVKLTWSDFYEGNNKYDTRILKWEDVSRGSFVISTDIVFGLKVSSRELGRIYTPIRSINDG